MRVAIIGSRDFNDADLVERCVQRLVDRHGEALVVVSRGMRGTGRLVDAAVAKLCKRPAELCPVNWDETYAGQDQNRALVIGADQLIVLWDARGERRGRDVLHAAKVALDRKKPLFFYDVQRKTWVTERARQRRAVDTEFPLIPWHVRDGTLNRYRGY